MLSDRLSATSWGGPAGAQALGPVLPGAKDPVVDRRFHLGLPVREVDGRVAADVVGDRV